MKPCNLRKCIVRRDEFQIVLLFFVPQDQNHELETLETKGPRIERDDGPSESFPTRL